MKWRTTRLLNLLIRHLAAAKQKTERSALSSSSKVRPGVVWEVRAKNPRGLLDGEIYRPPEPLPSAGVFFELTSLLLDLARLRGQTVKLDSRRIFSHSSTKQNPSLFQEIFRDPADGNPSSNWLAASRELHHSDYRDIPWNEIRPFIRAWFHLRDEIIENAGSVLSRHSLNQEEILAVNLRGSGKPKEIVPAPIDCWVGATTNLLQRHPALRVAVFSDDQDLVDEFTEKSLFDVIDIGQEVRTRGGDSINAAYRAGFDSHSFVKNFVARNWLVSQSPVVLTHTGNTALWTCAFRGCACAVYQFNRGSRLLRPYPNCDRQICPRHQSA